MREELARLLDGLTGTVRFCNADPRWVPACLVASWQRRESLKCSDCFAGRRIQYDVGSTLDGIPAVAWERLLRFKPELLVKWLPIACFNLVGDKFM